MESQPIEQAVNLALKKKALLNTSLIKYLLKAVLAGVYVGIGLILSYRLAEGYFDIHSPTATIMASIFFGVALVLIIYGGAELFTGNTMYFTMSTLRKQTTIKDTLQNWLACYSGNLIGGIFFALLIVGTGLYASAEDSHYLMKTAAAKMDLSIWALFFRGILCNLIVCLAVWIPMHIKGDGAKILVTMLLVFGFVASGFEHSVANMVTFSLALTAPHPETITFLGAIYNLIPVTIGNIVGGGFFLGGVYAYLASPDKQYKQSNRVAGERKLG
ncbi:formate/nitrite transporter family protein [Virgibacillus pantothenticus]|uniref:formate/nitrite transporter family protein n=1 Tax=Virgibacillus pantothenticus TaxID=1473 RepID=UPI00098497C0|nr:formate/nitrite transporter family protein [Virgibacillus pantothenticus]